MSASDKATQIREKDLSPEDKQALDLRRATDAQSEGSYAAARAGVAQLEGRGKDFEKYAKEADKFLERAMKFAESGQDANLIEDIGKQQAGVDLSRAKGEDQKAAAAEAQAAGLMDQLNAAQAKLKELQGEASTIAINADITGLVNKLAEVEAKLAAIPDKTVTVTVNTVNGSTCPAQSSASRCWSAAYLRLRRRAPRFRAARPRRQSPVLGHARRVGDAAPGGTPLRRAPSWMRSTPCNCRNTPSAARSAARPSTV